MHANVRPPRAHHKTTSRRSCNGRLPETRTLGRWEKPPDTIARHADVRLLFRRSARIRPPPAFYALRSFPCIGKESSESSNAPTKIWGTPAFAHSASQASVPSVPVLCALCGNPSASPYLSALFVSASTSSIRISTFELSSLQQILPYPSLVTRLFLLTPPQTTAAAALPPPAFSEQSPPLPIP